MPNNLTDTNQPSVNIKKTAGGIVSLTNNNFTPTSISLQGTFGRKFRILFEAPTDLLSGAKTLNKMAKSISNHKGNPIPGFLPMFKKNSTCAPY